MLPIRANVVRRHVPYVTLGLIFANVALFLVETSLPRGQLNELVYRWGVVPARQTVALDVAPLAVEYWVLPVLTSMFLHGGWAHLIGNMLFLWVFGDAVEDRLGSGRFALLYGVGGVLAAQLQVVLHAHSSLPMIGASGAIAGVLGAYLVLLPLTWVTVVIPIFFWPVFFDVPALLFLALWFVQQLMAGAVASLSPYAGEAGGVAWWAHVGGFAGGIALVGLMGRRHSGGRRTPAGYA